MTQMCWISVAPLKSLCEDGKVFEGNTPLRVRGMIPGCPIGSGAAAFVCSMVLLSENLEFLAVRVQICD
jgi:hypothetical protein